VAAELRGLRVTGLTVYFAGPRLLYEKCLFPAELLPAFVKYLLRWTLSLFRRIGNRLAVKSAVVLSRQPQGQDHHARLRVDAQQVTVEQGMDITPEQQPVLNLVPVGALVGVDVGSFERSEFVAARHCAAAVVCADEFCLEGRLAFPPDDLGQCPLAGVLGIEGRQGVFLMPDLRRDGRLAAERGQFPPEQADKAFSRGVARSRSGTTAW
jgi:hypothetical protein